MSHPDQKEMMTQSLQSNTLPRLPKPREEIKVKKEMPLPSQVRSCYTVTSVLELSIESTHVAGYLTMQCSTDSYAYSGQ